MQKKVLLHNISIIFVIFTKKGMLNKKKFYTKRKILLKKTKNRIKPQMSSKRKSMPPFKSPK